MQKINIFFFELFTISIVRHNARYCLSLYFSFRYFQVKITIDINIAPPILSITPITNLYPIFFMFFKKFPKSCSFYKWIFAQLLQIFFKYRITNTEFKKWILGKNLRGRIKFIYTKRFVYRFRFSCKKVYVRVISFITENLIFISKKNLKKSSPKSSVELFKHCKQLIFASFMISSKIF